MTEVYEPLKWDGGDRHYGTGELFFDKNYAMELAGQYGNVKTLKLFSDIDVHKRNRSGELRRKALSKLTQDEIYALGIKEES